jgi:hypothetical protein
MKKVPIITIMLSLISLTTITAMQKEVSELNSNIVFTFNNELSSTLTLLMKFANNASSILKINPRTRKIFSTDPDTWNIASDRKTLIMKINDHAGLLGTKTIVTQFYESNKLAVQLIGSVKEATKFNLEQSRIIPITFTENLQIQIGEPQIYHTQEIRPILPTSKKITIKGKEFPVQEEHIKLRAPSLRHLTQ